MLKAFHTLLNSTKRWLLLGMMVLTLPTLLNAQSALSDDAQTSNTTRNADKNFGATPTLTVSPSSNAYLKFRLSSTLAAGTSRADIAKATIKLYLSGVASPGKIDVYEITGPWEEAALTLNNAPAIGSLIATTAQIEVDKKNEFLVIDVTQAVKEWLGDDGLGTNGAPNYGLLLVPHPLDADTPAVANITFDSKENTLTGHEAQMDIALTKSVGLQNIAHDGTLSGDGSTANPLSIPNDGIGTAQLADSAVTDAKLANGISYTKLTGAPSSLPPNGQASGDLTGSYPNPSIADGAVTAQKIAAGQVLKSLNGLSDNVTLQAGSNITVTPSGNTLRIDASGNGLSAVSHNGTLSGDGTSGSPLSVVAPLALAGSGPNATLLVSNGGGGPAIVAAGSVDTSTQYRIGGNRVLGIAGQNIFIGVGSGQGNTTGTMNSFSGSRAGFSNTTGSYNSFFGRDTGYYNTEGIHNSFFGNNTGVLNSTGQSNSFFGSEAGFFNTDGNHNSFFGWAAGNSNTSGGSNSFVGSSAGYSNTTGYSNSFFGASAGRNNTTGLHNSFFGLQAGYANTVGELNSFYGTEAGRFNTTGQLNSFFGSNAGFSNTTGIGNSFVGKDAGRSNTTASHNAFFGWGAGMNNVSGFLNTFIGKSAGISNVFGNHNTFIGAGADGASGVNQATAIGANAMVTQSNSVVLGALNDRVGIGTTAPQAKLHVQGGDIVLQGGNLVQTAGRGVLLKSPNGTLCRLLTIDNAGSIALTAVACPPQL